MSSYYAEADEAPEVRVIESAAGREVPCPAHCNGGLVLVHGQETDCIECEGYGSVIV